MRPGISPAADLVVSFLVGCGATTLLAFWVSLLQPSAGLNAALAVIALSVPVALGVVGVLVVRARPHLAGAVRWRRIALWWLAPAAVLAYECYLLLTMVVHSGPGWDGIFVWEIKARSFVAAGGVPPSFFHDLSRVWSHLGYPFLLPLTEALAYRALGTVSQGADMLITAAFVGGLLVLFFELVRRTHGPGLAAVFTLLLMTVPAFWDNSLSALADLPLALFIMAGAWFVYRWFDHGRHISDLVLGGVLLALAIWVKREGLIEWGAGAAAIAGWTVIASLRRSLVWKPLAAYVTPIVAILPWLLTVAREKVPEPDYVALTATWFFHHADRIPIVLEQLGSQLVLVPTWGIAWILIVAGIVLRPPRSPGRGFLLVAVAAHLLLLTIIYTFSAWSPYINHVTSSIGRVVFHVFPLGLLLLATGINPGWWRAFGRPRLEPRLAEERVSGWWRP